MAKTSLIERMEKKGAPKAWVAEVRTLLRIIKEMDEILETYLNIIDNLARRVEALEANTSKSVLRRLAIQLNE